MTCERFTGGFTATHGYLLRTPAGALLIDAPEGVAGWLAGRGIIPGALLLTHQHFDHVIDTRELQALGVRIFAWSGYAPELTLEDQARSWGLKVTVGQYVVDEQLEGRGQLALAGLQFALLPVPGHSPDSVAFHLPDASLVFAGDTLMGGSLGRTDLPHGDHDTLLAGIRRHLLGLPDATRVLAGHGEATTIGAERAGNPWLR